MAKLKTQRKNVGLYALAFGAAAIAGVLVLMLLLNSRATDTYYVLNQDVPTRTQVTPEMLTAVTTTKDSAPANAIGLGQVQSGGVVTQYSLDEGDILTASNSGETQDIAVGVPDSWVVTNFSVPADDAVGGRITRGYYFDIMVSTPEGSFYPFVNVLALDTTVSLDNASSSEAADTAEAYDGQTTQYVVGMSPADAGKLQQIMAKYGSGKVKLVISPMQNEYDEPHIADYEGTFKFTEGDSPTNQGKDTDRTFTKIERKADGTPLEEVTSCSNGNSKPTADECDSSDSATTDDE